MTLLLLLKPYQFYDRGGYDKRHLAIQKKRNAPEVKRDTTTAAVNRSEISLDTDTDMDISAIFHLLLDD